MERIDFMKTSGYFLASTSMGTSLLSACKAMSGISDTPIAQLDSYELSGNIITMDTSKIPELIDVGGSVKLSIKEKDAKLIIVRYNKDQYLAFPDKCTHGDRELEYDNETKKFTCVSMGHSEYSYDGDVLKGPAELKLEPFALSNIGSILSIQIA